MIILFLFEGKYPCLETWFAAMEARPTYIATKTDYYTHAFALPPQLGGCVMTDEGGDRCWLAGYLPDDVHLRRTVREDHLWKEWCVESAVGASVRHFFRALFSGRQSKERQILCRCVLTLFDFLCIGLLLSEETDLKS